MPGPCTGLLLAALALAVAGCGSGTPETPAGGRTGLADVQDFIETEQGSIELDSHELGVKVSSLGQIEATPLPKTARRHCRRDGRSLVLGIARTKVRCFDVEALDDYFGVALFENSSQAERQANLFGADDKRVSSRGMPEEAVCTTGADGGPREGIVYCDLLVDRRILLMTHSETGRSRAMMRFAYDWLSAAG